MPLAQSEFRVQLFPMSPVRTGPLGPESAGPKVIGDRVGEQPRRRERTAPVQAARFSGRIGPSHPMRKRSPCHQQETGDVLPAIPAESVHGHRSPVTAPVQEPPSGRTPPSAAAHSASVQGNPSVSTASSLHSP